MSLPWVAGAYVCIVLVWATAAPGADHQRHTGGPFRSRLTETSPNTPSDSDDDGLPDRVYVTDWDGDGSLEMEDIQAAVDALTDPDQKTVEVGPGSFLATGSTGGHLLQLPSNLSLVGSGRDVTILNGFDPDDIVSVGAVVSNRDHVQGNANIMLRELTIDGRWASGDATGFGHSRMGVYFNRCGNCRVESCTIRDTLHACLYSKNGQGIYFESNTLLRCGNYTGQGAAFPCVYLFADSGQTQQDVFVSNNTCHGSGVVALSTRRHDPTATLRNIRFTGNSIANTRAYAGHTAGCLGFSGVDGGYYIDNVCIDTGSVLYYAEAYYSDFTDAGSSRNILVDGLQILPNRNDHGLQVHGYLQDATFRNIEIAGVGPDRYCMVYDNPLRNVTFDNISLTDCGRSAISESLPRGTGEDPQEGLTFRGIDIARVDEIRDDATVWPAVDFRGPVKGLVFESVTIDDVTGSGIRFDADVSESCISGVTISNSGLDGITAAPGSVWEGVLVQDNTIDGTGFRGISLPLNLSDLSRALALSGNQVSDFGRAAPDGEPAVGIEISGAIDILTIDDNDLVDVAGQARFGIVHDVWPLPEDLSYLCTNRFAGTFSTAEQLWVVGAVSDFQNDADGDASLDGCDCRPSDATSYPGAAEVNDGLDNQCPGDLGWGVVDETSGNSGFHNPNDDWEYSWTPQVGAAAYEVLRSIRRDLGGDCLLQPTVDTYWIDETVPPPGGCFYYLNRPAIPRTGSWGQDSGGEERFPGCALYSRLAADVTPR